jgi:hypothetical protein
MHLVVLDVELVLAVHVAHAGAKATDSAPAHTRKPQTHALARHVDGELILERTSRRVSGTAASIGVRYAS